MDAQIEMYWNLVERLLQVFNFIWKTFIGKRKDD